MTEITLADKLACVERELNMRRSVYPRWVAAKKMSAFKADREMIVMAAIVDDYRAALTSNKRDDDGASKP